MGRKTGSSFSKKKKKASKPTSPPPRTGHILVSDNAGTVVLCGGYNEKSTSGLLDVWSYTSSAGWTCVHDPPAARGSAATASSLTPLSRSMAAGCMIGSCVYIFGGLQQEGSQLLVYNDLWEFDLVTKRWRCLAEEVAGVSERSGATMLALPDGCLLLYGGECLGVSFSDCFTSNPMSASHDSAPSFTLLPTPSPSSISSALLSPSTPTPCPRASHSLTLCSASVTTAAPTTATPSPVLVLVLFGGTTTQGDETLPLNDVWTLTLTRPTPSPPGRAGERQEQGQWQGQWSPVASSSPLAPSPRSLCAAVAVKQQQQQQEVDSRSCVMMSTSDESNLIIMIFGGFGLLENNDDSDSDSDGDSDGDEGREKMGEAQKESPPVHVAGGGVSTSDVTVSLELEALKLLAPASGTDTSTGTDLASRHGDNEGDEKAAASHVDGSQSQGEKNTDKGVDDDDGDDDEEEEGSIAEGYLSDCWLLDVSSGRFLEVPSPLALRPRGGCGFASLGQGGQSGQEVLVFGGFDGEEYAGHLGSFHADA